mmetsp:Transcript_6396/g.8010  ORF Transcript_6396/g.8010 Transcript_6396/m.8010 type:complete len:1001 (-) Transcript_6396:45-3047(-)
MAKVLSKATNLNRKKSTRSIRSVASSTSASETINSAPTPPQTPPINKAANITNTSANKPATSSGVSEDDKLIKSLLKQFKKLEIDLAKFNSKTNSTTKANILRATVLPFLRTLCDLNESFPVNSKVHKSLLNISTSVLLKWWSSLLNSLMPKANQQSMVSSTDRNAYLECISRILSRKDWTYVDKETHGKYEAILIQTLDYCINKLQSMKIVPIAISAFVGKVFAYSFFNIPNISNALLFLLNVKQYVLESNLLYFKDLTINDTLIDMLYDVFPSTTHYLIDFKGLPNLNEKQKLFINSITPPTHPVRGIQDPNGPWVRRWCNSDSDVFNSFFRHYVTILQNYLAPIPNIDLSILFHCPGFNVIISHICQIFQVSITRISNNNMNKLNNTPPNAFAVQQQAARQHPPQFPPQNKTNSTPPPLINVSKQNDIYYNSILKVFKTIRDIKYSKIEFSTSIINFMDNLFISIAKDTSIYDHTKNGLLLNVVYEFINHVSGEVNWEFWLGCVYMMLNNTDHIQIVLKNLAFLFNVWGSIPERLSVSPSKDIHLAWLVDLNESFKLNFINWLISNEVWERFFVHWNPMIRSFYLRLIVWRVIGVNNFESSISYQTTKKVEDKLQQSYARLSEFNNQNIATNLNFKADNPLVNRKFGIQPINTNDEFILVNDQEVSSSLTKPSEIRKTHPFEIFDEAIYSCSSLPGSPKIDTGLNQKGMKESRNNSLVSSLGKFFKILSVDEKGGNERIDNNLLKSQRNSVSLTSLSTTFSIKSRSSSPSIMSFKSTPTSFTEASTNSSSSKSDSDSSSIQTDSTELSELVIPKPPELYKVPPEIVRPAYKFGIIIDHDSMNEKYRVVNNHNKRFVERSKKSNNLPLLPKIPCISVFLNSDPYDKFYITNENLLVNDPSNGVMNNEFDLFNNIANNKIKWLNLGKSLNEWNSISEEFENYLIKKIKTDQFNFISNLNGNENGKNVLDEEICEQDYLKRITPFLPVDGSNESKILNAG